MDIGKGYRRPEFEQINFLDYDAVINMLIVWETALEKLPWQQITTGPQTASRIHNKDLVKNLSGNQQVFIVKHVYPDGPIGTNSGVFSINTTLLHYCPHK